VQSFLRLRQVDPGFVPQHLLTGAGGALAGSVSRQRCQSDGSTRGLLERLRSIPGVRSAATARALPMTGKLEIGDWSFVLEGQAGVATVAHGLAPGPTGRS